MKRIAILVTLICAVTISDSVAPLDLASAANEAASPSLTAGPWQLTVTSFKTQETFELPLPGGAVRRITPEKDATIAVVGLKCKVLRAYTKEEEAQLSKAGDAEDTQKGRSVFGNAPFLSSRSFLLGYIGNVQTQKKLILSTCRAMDCTKGLSVLSFTNTNTVVGYSTLDSPLCEVTLAFEYGVADKHPLLLFSPIPDSGELFAARITVEGDAQYKVEYGTLEQMKKYMPEDLRSKNPLAANANSVDRNIPAVRPIPSASPDTPATTKAGKLPNWPALTADVTGRMEVRIKNPNDFKVKVGLRSEGKGKDFTVGANDTQSVSVPNGRYDIYFQYSTDPDGLYQGDSFTLNNNGIEIKIVKVVGGNYGIKKVK